MGHTLKGELRLFSNLETLSQDAAREIVSLITRGLLNSKEFTLVLSGGETPRPLYRKLATTFKEAIPWTRLQLFFGDERYVPRHHPESNYRMARETLLEHVTIPEERVHPIPTDFEDPEEAAMAYERTLKDFFRDPWPRFDLLLLGLGEDGHTASLFPKDPVLKEKVRWVRAVLAPPSYSIRERITLSLPVLNHARNVFFLAAGERKRNMLKEVLRPGKKPREAYPASLVCPKDGKVVWWLSEEGRR